MKNPRLWWPNGYGAQPQYDLSLQFVAGGSVSHAQTVRFGVRQITSRNARAQRPLRTAHPDQRPEDLRPGRLCPARRSVGLDAGADRYRDPLLRPGEPEPDLLRGHRQSARLPFRRLRPLRRDDRPMLLRLFLDEDRLEVSGRRSFGDAMLPGTFSSVTATIRAWSCTWRATKGSRARRFTGPGAPA